MSIRAIFAAAAIASVAGAASANVINVQYTGTGRGQSVHVSSPWYNGDVFAGQLKHTLSGATGADAIFNGNWTTFCSDLADHVSSSVRSFSLVPVEQLPDGGAMGTAKAQAIADMYAFAAGTQLLAGASNSDAAAFQLAIWEVITDFNPSLSNKGLSLTAGSFRATSTNGSALPSAISSRASSLLSAIGVVHGDVNSLEGIKSSSYQDQIIPIPAPGSALLAGLGFALIARRKRA